MAAKRPNITDLDRKLGELQNKVWANTALIETAQKDIEVLQTEIQNVLKWKYGIEIAKQAVKDFQDEHPGKERDSLSARTIAALITGFLSLVTALGILASKL